MDRSLRIPSPPRDRKSPATPILFVHVPKTAGTALFALAAKIYGRVPGQVDPRVVHLKINWNESDGGFDVVNTLDKHKGYPIRFISGHCSHQLRNRLPFDPIMISMLRDPKSRVLSAYNNMRRDKQNGYHELATRMSLPEILEKRAIPELENGQVRRLAGLPLNIGPLDQAHLQTAKRHMDQEYAAVGLTERFDETVELLRILLRWPRKGYMPWNVAPPRQAELEISSEARQLIEDRNAFDIDLYAHAVQRFDRQIASLQPEFDISVKRTQHYNQHWYRHWHQWAVTPVRNIKRLIASHQRAGR
ncbi:MAG: sulfotransferase family 2 domain-containing protein [Pirellulaceae bacterium]|nr:sulfotransferase family 2 domain-containing protein [Pirellulaceae bacterium]